MLNFDSMYFVVAFYFAAILQFILQILFY